MNLLSPVDVRDFDALGRKHNGKEIIAALNIIKAANEEGLNLNALVRSLELLASAHRSPFGSYPFKDEA